MNKIIIFGADGFIGQHLVRALSLAGDSQITAFDRFKKYANGLENPLGSLPNVKVVTGDFFNRNDVANVLEEDSYVFHLVSSTNPAASSRDPLIDLETNVKNSIELFELCVDKRVKKIIFPSSGGTVYGDIENELISEDTVPQPRSPYGIGKITIENYLRYFKFTHGLDYTVYRIANPYGPGQNIYGKQGVIPIFMHKFLTEQPVTIYGDGSMTRDYIYIDDLVGMIIESFTADTKHAEYNLGSGKGLSVNEILASIENEVGRTVDRKHAETPATFVQKSALDINRYITDFGEPRFIELTEGIRRTWEYVKSLG